MDLQLKGKRAMIAAASKGLGFGIAQALAREGCHISICARSEEGLTAAAQTISQETGVNVIYHRTDMSKRADIERWTDESIREFRGLDLLVVNAGGPPPGGFEDFTDEGWQSAFELTLLSVVRTIRAALPALRESPSPAILAVTSLSIREPIPNLILSNVYRAGASALLKSLANELAADGIRVNNLAPGRIDTSRVRALDETIADAEGLDSGEVKARHERAIPLGRYGSSAEFGRAAAFLLSPAAGYITGQTLCVDGGMLRSL